MKRSIKLALFGVGLFALTGLGVGLSLKQEAKVNEPMIVLAKGEDPVDPETPETLPCQVVIGTTKHGSIKTDITEGNVGDICTITAKHDLLYRVGSVSVNGVALIESETTSGEFSFALVEGENKITATFVIDEELCGDLSDIIREATEQDWNNLFTVENVIVLVKWVLDGGILIAMIRYYVKDKRLEKKLESRIQSTMETLVPQITEKVVLDTVTKVIQPMFGETKADYVEIMRGLQVFAKCTALAQENTPEAKRAILDELSGLKIGDLETIDEVKRYIEELVARQTKAFEDAMTAIKEIGEKQSSYIGEEPKVEEPKVEEPKVEEPRETKLPTE